MAKNLREKVIRLAYASKPSVRKALLNVLTETDANQPRGKVAFSMNVGNTPLEEARAYAEEKLGKEVVDREIPDFDKNYLLLQKKVKAAPGIPRIQMPVIEPQDIDLFQDRLNEGKVDIFRPYAKGKFVEPRDLTNEDGPWIELGFTDGSVSDDKLRAKMTKIPAGRLKPTQNQIWVENVIGPMAKWGLPSSSSPVVTKTLIVSSDMYILDGHHRFAQATLADPDLKMQALLVPLPIKELLHVGRAYGEAIGNRPKQGSRGKVALDTVAVSELQQYIENDGGLYRRMTQPIMKNMMKKMLKGQYDSGRSVKAWMYLVDAGAKQYNKEFGSPGVRWNDVFPKNVRAAVAAAMAADFEEEVKVGGYGPEDFGLKGELPSF